MVSSDSDSFREQQAAISLLASLKRDDADAILAQWLDKLLAGTAHPAIQLDLLNAAKERGTSVLVSKAEAFDKTRQTGDHLRDYREALVGGNAARGREIFFGRADVSCRRCHKIDGSGGDVGPDLSRIGLEKQREYLLESLVEPNRQIAKGFETVILQMDNGKIYAGIIKSDDGQMLQLQSPDGQVVGINKSDIEEQTIGKSGMPDDLVRKLTKYEIRDLVEYLSSRKSTAPPAHGK
jgi:quinoprotein glucose dehydrogenase